MAEADYGDQARPWKYVSPYGDFLGVADRLRAWSRKLRLPNPNVPFQGGLIADLEVAVRLLNFREFAEWLQVHGDDDQKRWATDILELADDHDETQRSLDDVEAALPAAVDDGETYGEAVGALKRRADVLDEVRKILVRTGAMSDDEQDDYLPALVQALLS